MGDAVAGVKPQFGEFAVFFSLYFGYCFMGDNFVAHDFCVVYTFNPFVGCFGAVRVITEFVDAFGVVNRSADASISVFAFAVRRFLLRVKIDCVEIIVNDVFVLFK